MMFVYFRDPSVVVASVYTAGLFGMLLKHRFQDSHSCDWVEKAKIHRVCLKAHEQKAVLKLGYSTFITGNAIYGSSR